MIISIIVTYHPNLIHLASISKEIKSAGSKVVIFDNTPNSNLKLHEADIVLSEKSNLGIAYGFNRCIEYCNNTYRDIEAFVFFDQDSSVKADLLQELINVYERIKRENIPLGVLGANPIGQDGKPYSIRRSKEKTVLPCNLEKAWFVISSFSMISSSTFEELGLFREDLFIDLVDSEFSFRCSKHNKINLISTNIEFIHEVGVSQLNTFWGRKIAISSPIRNYYQIRNAILIGLEYKWHLYVAKLLSKRLAHTILSGLLDGSLRTRIRYFIQGVNDGFRGITGKYR